MTEIEYNFFFFQAEDGIRDFHVTGVQTCALPICREPPRIIRRGDLLTAEGAGLQLAVHSWGAGEIEPEEDALAGSFELASGERALLALVAAHEQPLHAPSRDHVEARLDATCRVWERWLGF